MQRLHHNVRTRLLMMANHRKIVKKSIRISVISSILSLITFLLVFRVLQIFAIQSPKQALINLCTLSFLWTLGLCIVSFDREISSYRSIAMVVGFGSLVALLNWIGWSMIFSWGFSRIP